MPENNALALGIKPPEPVQMPDAAKMMSAMSQWDMSRAHAGLYSLQAAQQARMLKGYDVWQRTNDLDAAVKAGLPPEVPHALAQTRMLGTQQRAAEFELSGLQTLRGDGPPPNVGKTPLLPDGPSATPQPGAALAPGAQSGAPPLQVAQQTEHDAYARAGHIVYENPTATSVDDAAKYLNDRGVQFNSDHFQQWREMPPDQMKKVSETLIASGKGTTDASGQPLFTPQQLAQRAQMLIKYGGAHGAAAAAQIYKLLETMVGTGKQPTAEGVRELPGAGATEADIERQKQQAGFPFKFLTASASQAGRPIKAEPGVPITTGADVSPVLRAAQDAALSAAGIKRPDAVASKVDGPVYGKPVGMVHNIDGSSTSTVTPADVDTSKKVADYVAKRQDAMEAYGDLRYSADAARKALREFPTGQGTAGVNEMADRAAKLGFDVNAMLPKGWQTNPTQYAIAIKNIDRLAAAWAHGAFPSRITNSDLVVASRANIGVVNTNGANEKILDSVEDVAKVRQEEAKFLREFKFTPGHMPDWSVVSAWHDRLANMKGVSQAVKDAYVEQSTLERSGQTSTAQTPWPEGAIRGSRNDKGEMVYQYQKPGGGGIYWSPSVGTIKDGFRFIGGDPAKKESWEKQ